MQSISNGASFELKRILSFMPRSAAPSKRMQACKRSRQRRKRCPSSRNGDPAPMNVNATAQMVTTTQVGCGKVRRVDNAQIVQECYEAAARNDWEWFKRAFGKPYPLPHGMTNSGIWRSKGR